MQISGISQKIRRSGNTGLTLPHCSLWLAGWLLPSFDTHMFSMVPTNSSCFATLRLAIPTTPLVLFLFQQKIFLSANVFIKSKQKYGSMVKSMDLQLYIGLLFVDSLLPFSLIHWGPMFLPYLPLKLKQRPEKLLISVNTGRFSEACFLLYFFSQRPDEIGLGESRKEREDGETNKRVQFQL